MQPPAHLNRVVIELGPYGMAEPPSKSLEQKLSLGALIALVAVIVLGSVVGSF